MPSNDHQLLGDSLLGDRPPVVPLFWETGDAELSQRIGTELRRIFEAAGFGALLMEVESAESARRMLHSPQLEADLHPHSLWENQPAFYARLGVSVVDALGFGGDLLPVQLITSSEVAATDVSEGRGLTFFLDPALPAAPSKSQIAAILAYYLFSAWRHFWRSKDGDVSAAFALERSGHRFHLGLSWTGPSWDGVVAGRMPGLLEEMNRRWRASASAPSETPCPDLNELLRVAVPEQGLHVYDHESGDPHVEIDNGEEKFWLKMVERLKLRRKAGWERRLGELVELGQQVALFTTANVIRWAETHLCRRFDRFRELIDDYLNPFRGKQADRAALSAIGKRIESLGDRNDLLGGLQAKTCFAVHSLEENLSALKRCILGLPALKSASLRLALIGVACAWLFIGGMLWTGRAFTAMDYQTRVQVGWVIGGAYGLLVLLLLGRWVWYHMGILRLEKLAIRDIQAAAAMEFAESVCHLSEAEVRTTLNQLKGRGDSLQQLKEDLDARLLEVEGQATNVGDPRFPEARLETFFQSRFDECLRASEEDFTARMAEQDFSMDAGLWIEQAHLATRTALEEIASGIAFEDVATTCGLTPADRENLVGQAIRNARRILSPVTPPPQASVTLFLADDWSEALGHRDNAVLRNDPVARNGLMALCAVPIALDGEGGAA